MAEGITRHFLGDVCAVYSAGTTPSFVHPLAIKVLNEIDIDISSHHSKSIQELQHQSFDILETVCDHAKETCPVLPGQHQTIHLPFEDPAATEKQLDNAATRDLKSEQAALLDKFREVRNAILAVLPPTLEKYI